MAFNYHERKQIQEYLQKKVTITRIAKSMGVSRPTLYKELRYGVKDLDRRLGNYTNYDADLAQDTLKKIVLKKVK